MKNLLIIPGTALLLALTGCEVEKTQSGALPDVDVSAKAGQLPKYEITKTQEGEMPDVDVDVKSGRLPKYDVDIADVDVGTKEVRARVPDVDVHMEEKTFTVPDIDINMPEDEDDPNS